MKNPISKQFLVWQEEKLKDPEYFKALCAEAISQFRNKLSYNPVAIKAEMRNRSIKGEKQYGDVSFIGCDCECCEDRKDCECKEPINLEEAIFEEVIDIMNYTQMQEFKQTIKAS